MRWPFFDKLHHYLSRWNEDTPFKFVGATATTIKDKTVVNLKLNSPAEHDSMNGLLFNMYFAAWGRDLPRPKEEFKHFCNGDDHIIIEGKTEDMKLVISALAKENMGALSDNCKRDCQELGLLASTSKMSPRPQYAITCY